MNKIKCYRLIERDGRYYLGHIVPEGRPKQSAIIMVAGYTESEANKALDTAIQEAPKKYTAKYELI